MNRFSLDEVLDNDPLELLSEIKAKNPVITADRLIASFEEINSFVEKNGREPQKSTDMNERGLFSRLKGIRENLDKIKALKKYDRFNLLNLEKISEDCRETMVVVPPINKPKQIIGTSVNSQEITQVKELNSDIVNEVEIKDIEELKPIIVSKSSLISKIKGWLCKKIKKK